MNAFVAFSCLLAVAQGATLVHHATPLHATPLAGTVTHQAHAVPVVRAATEYVSPAAHLVRAPQHDSALIESSRYGGNFAYKTVEKPAYAEVRPIIRKELVETGVSYSAGPAHVTKHVVPQAPIVTRSYETVQAAPVVSEHTHYRAAPAYTPLASGYAVPTVYGANYGYRSYGAYGAPLALDGYHAGLVY